MPFEHLDHAADLGLRATGETEEEAFCEAARGLFEVMVDLAAVQPVEEHVVRVEAESGEELLVAWLSELLAQKELSGLVFSSCDVRISKRRDVLRLDGIARGERLDRDRHDARTEVKGISYLGLSVRGDPMGWLIECVLDV